MKTTPSPIAFLLHEDAFIADPREPLRKLLEHGCNPNTKCHVESDAEPTSEFEEEDEGFVCPDNTYKYPSALKPEKFERSIGIVEYLVDVVTRVRNRQYLIVRTCTFFVISNSSSYLISYNYSEKTISNVKRIYLARIQ